MAMTSTEMLRQLGACIGCCDNPAAVDSDFCTTCIEHDIMLAAAIREVRAGTANPTVREVQTQTLRDLYAVIGHGATEMSPRCDECGKPSRGRWCSSVCREAGIGGRA